jgi:murein L,D-transpeptidase YafK
MRLSLIFVLFCIAGLAPNLFAEALLLPDALVMMPENEHAVIVEKQTQTLYVYSAEQDQVVLSYKFDCSTGEAAGPKTKAGDKKTPEGVYFLKDEYEDRYLTPVYGKKAFPSDYPNLLDLRQGKQGSAIWIHGTDKTLKPMDSNGCVALENKNIMTLSKHINLDATPLIIVETIQSSTQGDLKVQEERITGLLNKWAKALGHGSYHQYLSFYADDYVPDISWWETWLGVRKTGVKKSQKFEVELKNTGIYAHDGVSVVLMDMYLAVDKESRFLGKRQLFIRVSGGTSGETAGGVSEGPVIIGDLFQKRATAYESGEVPLVAAARELVMDDSVDIAVVETVEQWLAAWSAKDMAEYAAFYANDFYSDGLGKSAWVRRKKQLAKRYDYISVTGKDYKVIQKKDGYEVSFLQLYESSGFSTQGRKRLKLVRKGGLWKIYRENWKGK